MFEIPDDDENFWEDLPLEDITNNTTAVKEGKHSTGVKRLSSESEHLASSKRLRSHTVTSPETSRLGKGLLESQHVTAPKIQKQNLIQNGPVDCHQQSTSGLRDKEINLYGFSPIHSTSRVPSVNQHIVITENQEPVNYTRHQNRCMVDTPLQTPVRAKRKFPGPAGLLPRISPGSMIDNPHLNKPIESTSPEIVCRQQDDSAMCSQSGEEVFNENAWQTLLHDLGEDGRILMTKFSIATSLQKARKKLLPKGKVPLVIAVIETVDWQGSDASIGLKDKSGKIQGTVHQSLMKEHQCDLQPGTVVVLRKVSVISPTARNHYLNVTPANVVAIYSNTPDGLKTIRNTEKNKSLNLVLQNIESYLSEDMNVQRGSGQHEQKSLLVNEGVKNNTRTPGLTIQNISLNFDGTSQFNGCSNLQTPQRVYNSNNQTPQRADNSNIQTPKRSVSSKFQTPPGPSISNFESPQAAQHSSKFKFVKTPNIFSSNSRDAKVSSNSPYKSLTEPISSSLNNSSFSCAGNKKSFNNHNNISNSGMQNTNGRQYFSHTASSPKTCVSARKEQPTCDKFQTNFKRNSCLTDFNANKVMGSNVLDNTLKIKDCEKVQDSDIKNNAINSQIVPTRQNNEIERTGHRESMVKNGFRFKSMSKPSHNSNTVSDEQRPDSEKRINIDSNTSFHSGIRLKDLKEPPRPCFDTDTLWQDDLSDDLLSQLSEEMM